MNYPLLKPRVITVEEFRELEAQAPDDERWELIRGVIVKSMAGGTVNHNDIVQNVASTVRAELRRQGSPCRTSTENIRLDIGGAVSSTLPDVLVNCGPRRGSATTFTDAAAVVEVLSPSTRMHDQVDKLDAYLTLPGLETLVLIEQNVMRVVSYTRSGVGWLRREFERPEDRLEFEGLGVSITLAQVYEEIEFDKLRG